MIPSAVQCYSLTAGIQSGSISNPTEQIGLKIATSAYIQLVERSIKAIESALAKCDAADLKLVDIVYWKQSYTIEGAGMAIGLSRAGAYNRINKILCRIALEMGVVNL